MFVASFKTTRELNVVFGLLLLTFLALGIGDVAASSGLTKAGGYLGLLTAAVGRLHSRWRRSPIRPSVAPSFRSTR